MKKGAGALIEMTGKTIGVLALHGFGDRLDAVSAIEPPLTALGLPVRIPLLRGHGAETPDALHGVTWQDWVTDAEAALQDLLTETDQAIVIGYSMGTLAAVLLGPKYSAHIDSLVLAAPAIKINSLFAPDRPLNFLVPLAKLFYRSWEISPRYVDREAARHDPNYHWAPMDAILTLLEFTKVARAQLPEVNVPTLILHSRNDSTAAPESAEIVYSTIATSAEEKKIIWFEKTEHEMFRDCEREAVVAVIRDYVQQRVGMASQSAS